MSVTSVQNGHQNGIHALHILCLDVRLVEAKNCDDTQPERQLLVVTRATERHIGLKHALAQQCYKVRLHTILIGMMGTIFKCHTELPLRKLGLDRCKVQI